MTKDFDRLTGGEDAQSDKELPRPLRTLEDWQQKAAELEAERDTIDSLLKRSGEDPKTNPKFTHLLGQLAVTHEQIIHFETEALDQQFEG